MTDHPIIDIRRATPSDNVMLAELGARTFVHTFAADNSAENMTAYLAKSFGPDKQAAELADPDTHFLIAEVKGTPIGYAKLTAGPPPSDLPAQNPVELVRLYVSAEWLGRKVGATLMQASLTSAETKGHDAIWLGVWEENHHAIAFYERWGFVRFGDHAFWLGDEEQTDLLLGRAL